MEDKDIEELKDRLKQKDIVIDALRQEITSLKQKLRFLEGQDLQQEAAPQQASLDDGEDVLEDEAESRELLAGIFSTSEDGAAIDKERDEEIEKVLSEEDEQEMLDRAQHSEEEAISQAEARNNDEEAEASDQYMEEFGPRKKRRTGLWAALVFLLIILPTAVYFLYRSDLLAPYLGGPDAGLPGPAASDVEGMGTPDANTRVAVILSDAEKLYSRGDYEVCRKALIDSGQDLGPQGKEILSACRIMSDPSVIMDESPDPSWVRGLIDLLRSGTRWRWRQMASRKLGELKTPESVQALTHSLLSDRDWGVRCEAADALGRLGEATALNALKKSYRTDPENIVRIASRQAITRLEGAEASGTQSP